MDDLHPEDVCAWCHDPDRPVNDRGFCSTDCEEADWWANRADQGRAEQKEGDGR